ncbi:hypothetical protein [Streptomyces kebangsaanensis]|uniref:hypothetical protein n=1 Tax=Streptomyces kebangsaanensis TaxID=864058 RepID=UPI0009396FD9|nr:hypothetical protein [Streptomyces kebangsaanensis]
MRRTTALCLLAATALLALTACGSGKPEAAGGDGKDTAAPASKSAPSTAEQTPFADLSGQEIVDKAFKATRSATSLTLKGSISDGKDTVRLDLALDREGHCAGSIGMGGGNVDVIRTDDTAYTKFDEALLRSESEGEPKSETDSMVDMLADRWMKADADSDDAKEVTEFCDLDELLAGFEDSHSVARKGKATTLDGTPAFTLTEADGKDRYTLYVATEGKPYLLRIEKTTAKKPETLSFTDYGKPVPVTPPADKDIVDLDKL